ncbi:MAG: hypothetical protein IPN33_26755 [Saprospiraceae bacterium]|nr:hypothetical protein [Saprospiraceae bacterium]
MKVVILGAAESGVGAAILAQQLGYDLFVSDKGQIKDNYKRELEARAIPLKKDNTPGRKWPTPMKW